MSVLRALVQVVVLQRVVGQHVQLPGVDVRHVGLERERPGAGVKTGRGSTQERNRKRKKVSEKERERAIENQIYYFKPFPANIFQTIVFIYKPALPTLNVLGSNPSHRVYR